MHCMQMFLSVEKQSGRYLFPAGTLESMLRLQAQSISIQIAFLPEYTSIYSMELLKRTSRYPHVVSVLRAE